MDNIPVTQSREVGYRTITSSAEENKFNENVLYDILNLFNMANKLNIDLTQSKEIYNVESYFNNIKINEIKQLASNINNKIQNNKQINIYPSDCYVLNNENSANINLITNDITCKETMSTSKTNLYDEITGTYYVPNELNAYITPEANGIDIIDTNINNALDEQNGDYYVRKVITNNKINEITCELVITLPDEVITSRNVNTIILCPYPYQSIDVVSIEYMCFGSYIHLPVFNAYSKATNEKYTDKLNNICNRTIIHDCPNIQLNFKDVNINKIKIKLRQKNFIQNTNHRIFYLGLKNLNIYNKKYSKYNSELYFKLDFNKSLKLQNNQDVYLNNINAITNNLSEINLNIQYEFYSIDSAGIEHIITNPFPFKVDNNNLLVKVKIYNDLVTPNINHFQLEYEIK